MPSNSTPAATVRRNDADRRYEIEIDGEVAGHIDYLDDGGPVRLVHTEVASEHEGQGLAAQLVQHVLNDVRQTGRKVVPTCAYVARYIERHPEDQDLVAG